MTIAVPLEAAKALRDQRQLDEEGVEVGVSRQALDYVIEFVEHFATRELPGTTVVAGELNAILLNLPDVEPETFDLIRFNGRAFVPEVIEAVEDVDDGEGPGRFEVFGVVKGSKFLGEFEGESADDAVEKALETSSVNLCHQCSSECEDAEIDAARAERIR